ncbi:hypothetical protein EGH25_06420 [Haladaptatus sp. F3-133]|uniref:Nucleotide modification associated domain-containing protein n=1 Tax=Halorutilus salinus TaxID=2487751 RepID=A0A9Q4C4W4_9EURY|nr:hypothetical protein [Halorutilus salinus]MCX2818984.1 hypothetical protein [Halorutilus salinus]
MIVLSGVAADTTNVSPVPRIYDDGGFDYVPIPEEARDATTETRTYADIPTREGTAAGYLDAVHPGGGDEAVTGDGIGSFPLHHDPNFDALTYGERRPAYVNRLTRLEEGDAVVFYTGLRSDGADGLHRYAIGYIVVEDTVYFKPLDGDEARRRIRDHTENAHAKRFESTGTVDGNLVIVDGYDGGLFNRAYRLSERTASGQYYLRDGLQDALDPEPSGRDDRNAYLGGVKQAHVLRVGIDGFLRRSGART